jgi:hypothetical protein
MPPHGIASIELSLSFAGLHGLSSRNRKESSHYSKLGDWVFASPHSNGEYPYWPDILLAKDYSTSGSTSWHKEAD